MLQGDNFIVNASTRNLTEKESSDIVDFFASYSGSNMSEDIISNGVFYDEIYIYSEGNMLLINFDKFSEEVSFVPSYFTVQYSNTNTNIVEPISHSYQIKFDHSKYGNILVTLDYYINPQTKYGFNVRTQNHENLTGLLVKEYKTESMELENILDKSYKEGIIGINPKLSFTKII